MVDLCDKGDRTPLLWAAKNGHEGIVKLLLKKNPGRQLERKGRSDATIIGG